LELTLNIYSVNNLKLGHFSIFNVSTVKSLNFPIVSKALPLKSAIFLNLKQQFKDNFKKLLVNRPHILMPNKFLKPILGPKLR
jgi:hypothetical protein